MTLRLLEQLVHRLKALVDVVPAGADIVTLTGAQALTNKSISGAANTLSNIPLSALSSVYFHYKTASGNIPHNTRTPVVYSTLVAQSATGLYSTGTGLFTVPVGQGGTYAFSASAMLSLGAVIAEFAVSFTHGVTETGGTYQGGATSFYSVPALTLLSLAAGDTVGVGIYHSSSDGLQKGLWPDARWSWFMGWRIA